VRRPWCRPRHSECIICSCEAAGPPENHKAHITNTGLRRPKFPQTTIKSSKSLLDQVTTTLMITDSRIIVYITQLTLPLPNAVHSSVRRLSGFASATHSILTGSAECFCGRAAHFRLLASPYAESVTCGYLPVWVVGSAKWRIHRRTDDDDGPRDTG
jgi:hypothetical protein